MLLKRVITAIILIPLAILTIFQLSTLWFAIVIALLLALAAWEWSALIKLPNIFLRFLYIFFLLACLVLTYLIPAIYILIVAIVWWLLAMYFVCRYPNISKFLAENVLVKSLVGIIIFVSCWSSFVLLHNMGPLYVLFALLIIWSADTGAYFVGKFFGSRKLMPQVSPKKTIEGLIGGFLFSVIVAEIFISSTHFSSGSLLGWLIVVFITVLFSVVGDLFISMVKRIAGAKDSGKLLPGHGGVLDRIDSWLAALPMFIFAIILRDILI